MVINLTFRLPLENNLHYIFAVYILVLYLYGNALKILHRFGINLISSEVGWFNNEASEWRVDD